MADIRLPTLNKVMLTGYATRDAELRYTPGGAAVANFGIGSTRRYKDQSGEWKDETMFINVVAWQRWAELARDKVRRGSPLLVEGRLQSRSWETEDGQKRTVVELRADRFQFLEKTRLESDLGEGSDASAASQPFSSGSKDLDDVPF
jgi:single-strand DNA-binding protein